MKFKRKLWILAFLMLAVIACICVLPQYRGFTYGYDRFIFYPLQSIRIVLLGVFPFSVGDVLYILGGIWAFVTLIRWVYFIIKFRSYKERLAASVLRCINTVLFVYLFFVFGWGANYYKQPLRKYWELDTAEIHKTDTTALIAFNQFLLDRLNTYAPHFHPLSVKEINERSTGYYRIYTDCKTKRGLDVKPSLFGAYMEGFDIEGYYNPFTGEGQVNGGLSDFMLPFVMCHEMAHQAGVAAEGDANLMAYALCTICNDSSFSYSGYLNIWLYANGRLYFHDSALAKNFASQLNALTKCHIDTLDQIDRKYHNEVAKYSGAVYDSYLRMQNQREGIRSYGNVATSAWLLEQKRKNDRKAILHIP